MHQRLVTSDSDIYALQARARLLDALSSCHAFALAELGEDDFWKTAMRFILSASTRPACLRLFVRMFNRQERAKAMSQRKRELSIAYDLDEAWMDARDGDIGPAPARDWLARPLVRASASRIVLAGVPLRSLPAASAWMTVREGRKVSLLPLGKQQVQLLQRLESSSPSNLRGRPAWRLEVARVLEVWFRHRVFAAPNHS